jgi:hypothetical protein
LSQRPLLLKIAVAALVASAALFALGAALEHHAESNEKNAPAAHATAGGREHGEGSGETGSESREGSTEAAPAGSSERRHHETAAERRSERSSERIFGVNPDALPLVIAAVAISLLLAAALWLGGAVPALLGVIFLVGLGAAAFDVREAVHQADHSRPGIMAVAIVVALLHLLAAAAAAALGMGRRRGVADHAAPVT